MVAATASEIDFEADAAPNATSAPNIGPVARMVAEDQDLAARISAAEELVKQLKNKRRQLLQVRLVTLMDELGQPKVTLTDGTKVGIVVYTEATIPSDSVIEKANGTEQQELIARQVECLAWLEENGLGGIIKTGVNIDAGKGDNLRSLIVDFCKENNLTFTEKRGVHNATLKKALTEKIDKDAVLPPEELFNFARGRTAKITYPKTKS